MKALYLESSGLGRAYFHGDASALQALHSVRRGRELYASALAAVEMRRTAANLIVAGAANERAVARALGQVLAVLARATPVPLGDAVLARAGDAFPLPVRTLDAIHLATAVSLHQSHEVEDLVVFSRDNRVRDNAAALGIQLA